MENFTINDGNGKEVVLAQNDFEFVQNDKKIHDVKLKTKATTFFKDAMKRFVKSKASVTGGVIVGALMLFAFIVPVCTPNEGVYQTEPGKGGKVEEAFLSPKLFPAGTGFWDGTVTKSEVVLDQTTKLPVGYTENTVSNLKTELRYVDGVTSEHGKGGYVNIYSSSESLNSNFYTFIPSGDNEKPNQGLDFDVNTTYDITYNIKDVKEDGFFYEGHRLSFVDLATNKHYYLKGTDQEFDSAKGEFKVSLNLNSLGLTSATNSVKGALYFESLKSDKGIGFLPLESVSIKADKQTEANKVIESLSFGGGNEVMQRKAGDANYWHGDFGRLAHDVEIEYCTFTFDQYEAAYGEKEQVFGARELSIYQNNGSMKFNFETTGTKATTDKEVLKQRFEVVDSNGCPIVEIVEQVGDAKRKPNGQYAGFSVKAIVLKYKLLGYEKMPMYLFGTNGTSQDYFKLLFTGLRFSFFLAIGVSFVNILIGLIWGSLSGYFGGWTDILMERFCDILSGLPLTVIITLCILYGNELNWGNASDVLALLLSLFLTGWMGVAHQTRTQFYRFKGREYVLASRTLGAKDGRLIFKHILPNAAGTIITGSVLIIPSVIYTEASIAYLGLGLQNQTLFGVILSSANQYYTGEKSFLLFIPTFIMMLLLISFNLFGNGLRDAFNPQLKGSE